MRGSALKSGSLGHEGGRDMSAVIDQVYAMEVRLREAMLSADVELLDSILVDDLILRIKRAKD
jgi:hypothetical protein